MTTLTFTKPPADDEYATVVCAETGELYEARELEHFRSLAVTESTGSRTLRLTFTDENAARITRPAWLQAA